MKNTTVIKVNAGSSPHGSMGQKYLASGIHVAMRLWEKETSHEQGEHTRDYETVGYVIKGKAELTIAGQTIILEPGDSWVVPRGAVHAYNIIESFTAVEATTPPAHAHGRDEE